MMAPKHKDLQKSNKCKKIKKKITMIRTITKIKGIRH
jgi:hypothetical protein